jgi:hypothetical protein
LRAQILAELHDGLLHAIDDDQRAGIPHDEATELAMRRFGDPRTLANAFLPELAAARARRLAVMLLATVPFVGGAWVAAARSRGVANQGLFDSPAAHLTAALLALAVVGAGLWTIAATGRACRWLHPVLQTPQLSASAVAASLITADVTTLSALAVPLATFPGTLHRLALTAAILASLARLLLASRATHAFRRCGGASRIA